MGEPTLQELSKVQALLEERMNSNLAQQKSTFDKMQTDQARRDSHRDGILAEHKEYLGRAAGGHSEARRREQSGCGTARCGYGKTRRRYESAP